MLSYLSYLLTRDGFLPWVREKYRFNVVWLLWGVHIAVVVFIGIFEYYVVRSQIEQQYNVIMESSVCSRLLSIVTTADDLWQSS